MALGATMYRLKVELADVDRGVYESLDLRVAQHPSESMRYLLTRVLACCLCHEDGIAFGKGVSTAEEPAVWSKEPDGRVRLWIEVGTPSADRLHKARKASPRVVVFTHNDPAALTRAAAERDIFKVDTIEVFAVPAAFLDELEPMIARNATWQLTRTGGEVYVTAGDRSATGVLEPVPLGAR